jgi:hypothetical protein
MPCSLAEVYQLFGVTYCLSLLEQRLIQPSSKYSDCPAYSLILKMQTVCSSKMAVTSQKMVNFRTTLFSKPVNCGHLFANSKQKKNIVELRKINNKENYVIFFPINTVK